MYDTFALRCHLSSMCRIGDQSNLLLLLIHLRCLQTSPLLLDFILFARFALLGGFAILLPAVLFVAAFLTINPLHIILRGVLLRLRHRVQDHNVLVARVIPEFGLLASTVVDHVAMVNRLLHTAAILKVARWEQCNSNTIANKHQGRNSYPM